MLGLDLTVALALVLSVASAALCVGWGLTHWNADDDRAEDPPDRASTTAETGRTRKERGAS